MQHTWVFKRINGKCPKRHRCLEEVLNIPAKASFTQDINRPAGTGWDYIGKIDREDLHNTCGGMTDQVQVLCPR